MQFMPFTRIAKEHPDASCGGLNEYESTAEKSFGLCGNTKVRLGIKTLTGEFQPRLDSVHANFRRWLSGGLIRAPNHSCLKAGLREFRRDCRAMSCAAALWPHYGSAHPSRVKRLPRRWRRALL